MQVLQSAISSQYWILQQQVLQLAKTEGQLHKGAQGDESTSLSNSGIPFLALLNTKGDKRFSWFTTNTSEFDQPKVVKSILQQTHFYLSKNSIKERGSSPAIFPVKVLKQIYFVLVLPYTEKKSSLRALAVLPKLSFISWLPLQETKTSFSLLNPSSDIISHGNYSYIAKKISAPWAIEQNQMGLLEGQQFNYKNSDFYFQVFAKIEGSPLLLSASWKLYFWPLFFQLLAIFIGVFVLAPYFILTFFAKKKQPSIQKDFFKKEEDSKSDQQHKSPNLEAPAKESSLLDQQTELISLQELPAHSSIIKDLKNLIDDLDQKPLNEEGLENASNLSEKKQEQGL